MTIPKVIHYCWFGKKELPQSVINCINSWKKYCPDYEIKQWDESNFDVHKFLFTEEAYKCGKYAFVTDVARLEIISREGGVYLDTDVELLKNIDSLLESSSFMAMETVGRVNTGLGFGATKNHPFIIENLRAYYNRHFLLANGKLDTTSCVTVTTNLLEKRYGKLSNQTAYFKDMVVYEPKVFCPLNLETNRLSISSSTLAIHHYDATWKDGKDKFLKMKIKLRKFLGSNLYEKIKNIVKTHQ